jgi:hypothetical protein
LKNRKRLLSWSGRFSKRADLFCGSNGAAFVMAEFTNALKLKTVPNQTIDNKSLVGFVLQILDPQSRITD